MDSREPVQAVWSGSIVFGLVVLPVKLHPATSEKAVQFRQTHAADGGLDGRLRRPAEAHLPVRALLEVFTGRDREDLPSAGE
ncbi:hypothetical protein [Streptomyces tailanensis]|uniref:hypothetical protein n=1 Tax=Streptomyces tailanensis TaxID=2569858 RepID=UPI00122E41BB|nr:hypothetical protein [Streptomyces tailanensis]